MGLKILIADDSMTMRRLVTMTLKKTGLDIGEILEANDGQEALEMTKQHTDIDLIFLDWNMPKMNGLAFLQAFRFTNSSTPVIMITTEATDDKVSEAKSNGANGYITKPFAPDKITEEVNKFLS